MEISRRAALTPADAEAFASTEEWVLELYERFSVRIYNFMRYRLRSAAQAEDLTSMVFQRVIEKSRSYRPQRGGPEVWLFTVARNLLNDHFRKARRSPTVSMDVLEDHPAESGTPEEAMLRKVERDRLFCALQTLSGREVTALSLKYAGELSNIEIAGVMGLSEKNAGVILSRSRKKLKMELERMDRE